MALALEVARVHGAMLGRRKYAPPERKPAGVTMSFKEVEAALAEGKEVGLLNLLHYSKIKLGQENAEVKRLLRAQKLKKPKR